MLDETTCRERFMQAIEALEQQAQAEGIPLSLTEEERQWLADHPLDPQLWRAILSGDDDEHIAEGMANLYREAYAHGERLVRLAEALAVVEEVRDVAYLRSPGVFGADPGTRYAQQDGWARACYRIIERLTALAGGGDVE